MAMSMQARSKGGRRRTAPMSEINVTPMVDVMLVLLIIFMVAAPLLSSGVPIDLPKAEARAIETEARPITISVTPEGEVFLGKDPVAQADLVARVQALAAGDNSQRLLIRGDATAQYGAVMEIMAALSGAGFGRIGLVTEAERTP
ncbi:protein TolR [Devosia sp.]|uniref:protein TolR n=1 Tax=Devosia sp. TaxID=1871048 RepID=UPI003BAA2190